MAKYRIFTLGELLKDVSIIGMSKEEIKQLDATDLQRLHPESYVAVDGGSPANLAAYTCLLGGATNLVTSVGPDAWGKQLEQNMHEFGVDIRIPIYGDHTDAALIHRAHDGTHSFVKLLWGSLPKIEEGHIHRQDIENCDIVCLSTVPRNFPGTKNAVDQVLSYARQFDKIICVDVNLREAVYGSDDARMYDEASALLHAADIAKFSFEEFRFIAKRIKQGSVDINTTLQAIKDIHERYSLKITLVSCGEQGSIGYTEEGSVFCPGYNYGEIKSTVGAGDAFTAAFLNKAHEQGLEKNKAIEPCSLEEALDYACRVAGITITDNRTISTRVLEVRA